PSLPLSEDRLPFAVLGGWSLFYPSAGAAAETGAKRGCCVLASPAVAAAAAVPSLRLSRVI
ncbi:MAG TPA: hypothetical protein VNY84_08800, partial [Acidimicrobiales bacterium]|nr:hypothetical protein [Acidimicrobiales bacterium]